MRQPTIDLVYAPATITVFYSLYPILRSRMRGRFRLYTKLPDQPTSDSVLFVRYPGKTEDPLEAMRILEAARKAYRRVAFFDDGDSPECYNPEFLPVVDHYFKKQLYRDREEYGIKRYSKRLFADYYYRNFNVRNDTDTWREPVDIAGRSKLSLLWNLGIGVYPIDRWRRSVLRRVPRRLAAQAIQPILPGTPSLRGATTDREPYCSARFSPQGRSNSYAFQRELFHKNRNLQRPVPGGTGFAKAILP